MATGAGGQAAHEPGRLFGIDPADRQDRSEADGQKVSNKPRAGGKFRPVVYQQIPQIGQQPVKLVERSPERISVWIRNDQGNGQLLLGDARMQQTWPLNGGEAIFIDDNFDEIYAIFIAGAGGNVRVVENFG